jgi:hypothetical protein
VHRLGLIGYLAYNGVNRAVGLYVSEVDGRNFIISNSIDLKIEESTVKDLGHYVILAGIYHAPPGRSSLPRAIEPSRPGKTGVQSD